MDLAPAQAHLAEELDHLGSKKKEPSSTSVLAKAFDSNLSREDAECVALPEALRGPFVRSDPQSVKELK